MDLKEYLLSVVLVNRSETKLEMIRLGFEVIIFEFSTSIECLFIQDKCVFTAVI